MKGTSLDKKTMSKKAILVFAARGLEGQTPRNLAALSYMIDEGRKLLCLKAHFTQSPSETDRQDVMETEAEIGSHLPAEFMTDTEFEVIDPSIPVQPLPGGFCYVKPSPSQPCNPKGVPGFVVARVDQDRTADTYRLALAPAAGRR